MNTHPIGKKTKKDIFYVKEMTDKELESIDVSKLKKLSKKETLQLLSPGPKSTKTK